MMSYWKTVNENGGGYVHRAPAARSKAQIASDICEVKRDLEEAIINAAYKDGQDGTAYKVQRLQTRLQCLQAELA
jgi:hypothetical protein